MREDILILKSSFKIFFLLYIFPPSNGTVGFILNPHVWIKHAIVKKYSNSGGCPSGAAATSALRNYFFQTSPGPPSPPRRALRHRALQVPACRELDDGASKAAPSRLDPPLSPAQARPLPLRRVGQGREPWRRRRPRRWAAASRTWRSSPWGSPASSNPLQV